MSVERWLLERALDEAARIARPVFGNDVTAEARAGSTEWDPILLRHIADVSIELRAPLPDFDVWLDASGAVIGFHDAAEWPECKERPLAQDVLRELATATGVLPPETMLGDATVGPHGCLQVVAKHGERRWLVRCNAARGTIISIEPLFAI